MEVFSKYSLPQRVLCRNMASKKQNLPSFASIVSVLSIVFYCAGFLRVEFELHEYKDRIDSLERASGNQPRTSEPSHAPTTKNVADRGLSFQN